MTWWCHAWRNACKTKTKGTPILLQFLKVAKVFANVCRVFLRHLVKFILHDYLHFICTETPQRPLYSWVSLCVVNVMLVRQRWWPAKCTQRRKVGPNKWDWMVSASTWVAPNGISNRLPVFSGLTIVTNTLQTYRLIPINSRPRHA